MAQLSLYTLMLRARHGSITNNNSPMKTSQNCNQYEGSASGGMLLYLNDKDYSAVHVQPSLNESKSLINQRNIIAAEMKKTTKSRGIIIKYEKDNGETEKEKR